MAIDMSELLNLVQGKRAEIKARSGDFLKPVKPPVGKSRWRILPGWATPAKFFHDFSNHFIKDKDGNTKAVFLCENKVFGRSCAVCDKIGDLIRGTKDDRILKLLKESTSRVSYLVNAVRMDGENKDPKKPLLLELPTKAMDAYLLLMQERAGDGITLLDPDEGRDIVITREGSGLTTTYALNDAAVNSKVDPEALGKVINIEEWLENERTRGWSKGTAIVDSTLQTIVALPASTTTARISGPSMSSLVPASRVIEVEAEEVVVPTAKPAAAASEAVKTAPVAATAEADDEDLEALLAQLDK